MSQWWLMGRDRVPIGPVTTELVIQGIRAGKVPSETLACEVGETAWRSIRTVKRFAPSFAKLKIEGPTLGEVVEETPVTDIEDTLTVANAKLAFFRESDEERTIAEPAPVVDDFGPTQRAEESTEVTIVDRGARHSEPP